MNISAVFLGLVFSLSCSIALSFAPIDSKSVVNTSVMSTSTNNDRIEDHPFCSLPGDPSLILTTNVDLGDKKMAIMKGTGVNAG